MYIYQDKKVKTRLTIFNLIFTFYLDKYTITLAKIILTISVKVYIRCVLEIYLIDLNKLIWKDVLLIA